MSRSKNRKIADLISGTTFDDGVVAASEVTGLATVATSGSFSDLSNQPTPFDPSTLATVATTGAYSALSGTPTLGTASTQATGAFATAAQGTTADAALPKAGGAVTGNVTFGDNDKIVFGGELEIYSDATHARIVEGGSGQLKVQGNLMQLLNTAGSSTYLEGNDSTGAVTLYHAANQPKIATTTSGIDVTGTVNADALTGIGSIDATTKNAIEAAGVGGAFDTSGGVGSSGIAVTSTAIPPIGCLMFGHNGDSKVGGQAAKYVYYGRQFTAANASNQIRCVTANSTQNGHVFPEIRTGTWRVLAAAHTGGGDGDLIFQRIA